MRFEEEAHGKCTYPRGGGGSPGRAEHGVGDHVPVLDHLYRLRRHRIRGAIGAPDAHPHTKLAQPIGRTDGAARGPPEHKVVQCMCVVTEQN